MDTLSRAVELWLTDLHYTYACELANHAIGSEAIKYPSSKDAMMEMLREAYRKGNADAQPADFDVDVAHVEAINAANRPIR